MAPGNAGRTPSRPWPRDFRRGASRAVPANPLTLAKWIWSDQEEVILYFTRDFTVENSLNVETAVVTITAGQSYDLSLNGRFILGGNAAQRVRRVDISSLLRSGGNRFTVSVKKGKGKEQSGLVASLAITLLDGTQAAVETDHRWTCSLSDGGPQLPARELGSYNMPPWNLNDASIEQADIYPSYAVTAELLQRMGIENDFESDAPLRSIHRKDGDEDFYFIANGDDRPQEATCRFRVAGRQPEWWDAVTGEIRDLPEFTQAGGHTKIPMRLEAYESGFVMFRKPAPRSSSGSGANFPRHVTVTALAAPWDVGFDPKWGGPERVVFSQLEDWSNRSEPGIKHYSGKATYRTSFDCDRLDPGMRYFLSLGRVAVIASVKVNDRDLGVVWCEPWRIAVPTALLQPRGNSLEIVVANLWTNRLIGDSKLPEDQRFTWITGNPFRPDDSLLESGLLGPVRRFRVRK